MLTYIRTEEDYLISNIHRKGRARKDLGDVQALSDDIEKNGLINAVLVNVENQRLLSGGRRIAAHILLKRYTIRTTLVKVAGEIDELELELFENRSRKSMLWWEEALLDTRIHTHYAENNANWTQEKSAKHLNISTSELNKRISLTELIVHPEIGKIIKGYDNATIAVNNINRLISDKTVEKKATEILTRENDTDPEQPTTSETTDRKISTGNKSDATVLPGKYWKQVYKAYRLGDALKGMRGMKDGDFTGAEVDPPYGIDLQGNRVRSVDTHMLEKYREVDREDYPVFVMKVAEQVHRLLAEDTFCIWWFGIEWYTLVRRTLSDVGFSVPVVPCIWLKDKGQTNNPATNFGSMYETFFVARKGTPKLQKQGYGNVFAAKTLAAQKKVHPTEKPAELMDTILERVFPKNTRLLVPFLGSGRTLIEAHKMDMFGTGWDLEERNKNYFINAVKLAEDGAGDD